MEIGISLFFSFAGKMGFGSNKQKNGNGTGIWAKEKKRIGWEMEFGRSANREVYQFFMV